jgi:hypothetical protein
MVKEMMMRTKIENGQSVVIEDRDYMGKLTTPVYGTLQNITSDGTCIIELADGSTVYADYPQVESVEIYERIVAERANRKPVVVAARGLASDDGQAYDEYER